MIAFRFYIYLFGFFVLTAAAADKPSEKATDKPPETFQSSIEKQRAAMAVQRESVRKQVEMAEQWRGAAAAAVATVATAATVAPAPGALAPGALAPGSLSLAPIAAPALDCAAIPEVELTPLIDGAAQSYQVQTKLLRSVIERESGNRPCAVSVKGAKGLMQLMPATAEQFQVEDPFDAKESIDAGAQYLKQLLDRYKGDTRLALAAYNAGPATVDQAGGVPEIKETQAYVEAILQKLK